MDNETKNFYAPFSEELYVQRHRAGFSLLDLANAAGISRSALSRYERLERTPSAECMTALALALDLEPDHFSKLVAADQNGADTGKAKKARSGKAKKACKKTAPTVTDSPALPHEPCGEHALYDLICTLGHFNRAGVSKIAAYIHDLDASGLYLNGSMSGIF